MIGRRIELKRQFDDKLYLFFVIANIAIFVLIGTTGGDTIADAQPVIADIHSAESDDGRDGLLRSKPESDVSDDIREHSDAALQTAP